jgi:preprotein translocase subunit SecE
VNREYKRMMKKQEAEREKAPRSPRPAAAGSGGPGGPKRPRTGPRQFFKEVVAELRKVAWPTRQEVVGYSTVVLVSVVVIAALIFAMDLAFTKAILELFGVNL